MQDRYPHSFLESGSKPSAFLCCSAGRNPATRVIGMYSMTCLQFLNSLISLNMQTNTLNDVLHKPLDKIYHCPGKSQNSYLDGLYEQKSVILKLHCLYEQSSFYIFIHFLQLWKAFLLCDVKN